MPKSDKATVIRRVHDVVRLLVAGAEFADIRQFATVQGWQVRDRQIRRYMEAAYRRLARDTKRDRRQLLGRHVAQRKALYVRSVKGNDIRAALQVLRDEAALEGLYPPTKIAHTTPDDMDLYPGPGESPLNLRERISRCLTAHFSDDETEVQIVERISPQMVYECSDTAFPIAFLQVLAMRHTIAQLEMTVLFHQVSGFAAGADDDDNERRQRLWGTMKVVAYRMRVSAEAWARFTEEIGVDGQALIESSNPGGKLPAKGGFICEMAPTADDLPELAAHMKCNVDDLATVESCTREWMKLYAAVLHE
jgi:hypothetical protein